MSEPKAFASLSPALLARKGAARPAMRPHQPQVNMIHDTPARAADHDDLGWNDMGHDIGQAPQVVPIDAEMALETAHEVPEVVRQQKAIAQRVEALPKAPARAAAAVATLVPASKPSAAHAGKAARSRRSAFIDGRRAAFTLRVDEDRHLKLRLACTVSNRSAQQLVTEALDRLLEDLPELSTLAAQLARKH